MVVRAAERWLSYDSSKKDPLAEQNAEFLTKPSASESVLYNRNALMKDVRVRNSPVVWHATGCLNLNTPNFQPPRMSPSNFESDS